MKFYTAVAIVFLPLAVHGEPVSFTVRPDLTNPPEAALMPHADQWGEQARLAYQAKACGVRGEAWHARFSLALDREMIDTIELLRRDISRASNWSYAVVSRSVLGRVTDISLSKLPPSAAQCAIATAPSILNLLDSYAAQP